MNDCMYLIVHKDHLLDVRGVNSGAEMATLALAEYLVRAGRQVIVCGQLKDGEERRNGIEFWDLGETFDVTSILHRMRDQQPYHLISAGRAQVILESRFEANCCSRTLISHDRSGNDTGISPKVLEKVADNIICVSNAQSQIFLEVGVDPGKVHVIHNGVNLERFSIGKPEKRDYRRLIFVGALVQDKGIHFLIQSFADLLGKYPDLKLDVYGSAALWGRQQFIDEQKLAAQLPGLSFHGAVTQEVLAEAYREAGICVIPSIWFDPFPLTALEAQVTGCPVVTFDVGGLREGVRDGETGIVLTQVSQNELTACLDLLIGNPKRLAKFSERAIETARPYFNWERVALNVIELCEQSVKNRASDTDMNRGVVGILTTWNQECGLATYARYLANELPKGSFVILAEEALATRPDEEFVHRCWSRGSSEFDRLTKQIKDNDVKLLHLNCHYRFFPQPEFAVFLQNLRTSGIKVVAHLHTLFTNAPELQALVRAVDAVIVHNPESRLEAIANGANSDRVWVIPHGVVNNPTLDDSDKVKLKQELGLPLDRKIICSFGFVQPHKGIEALIEGVAELSQGGISAYGCVAGRPHQDDPNACNYQEQLRAYADKLGVGKSIAFLDRFLTEEEVVRYLQVADVVVMNYQSRYFEASGACSLAVGAGAVVVASLAPPLLAFGDAVWHSTDGYPIGRSLQLLLSNSQLYNEVQQRASLYSTAHSWPRTVDQILAQYRTIGFHLSTSKKERPVEEHVGRAINRTQGAQMRVLMQNRSNTFTQRGGDTVVLERLATGLKAAGVEVTVDVAGTENPANYDLVHLFNFALPDMVRFCGERAEQAGVPFVVTTLCEDIPRYRNQSCAIANSLIEYVNNGRSRVWFEEQRLTALTVPAASMFDNQWAAEHAACLFPNGAVEAASLLRHYGSSLNLHEVQLGCELGAEGDAERFKRSWNVDDFILCVGRLEFRKNQLMLLKALEDSELTVVLATGGFSYDADYSAAVRNFQRRGKTVLVDRLEPELLAAAYAAARVHVLPSWYELPGLVTLEAAHYGCNVVATRYGTTVDYLGDNAFYCDPGDPDSIRNSVLAAYYAPMREGARQVVEQFSWDNTVVQTLSAYKKVLGWSEVAPATTPSISRPQPAVAELGGYDMASGTVDYQETLERGELAARNKEYNVAIDLLQRALSCNPVSVRALRAIGAVYLAENNAEEAERYFQQAFDLDQRDPKTLSGLGMCAMKLNRSDQAYQYFVEAMELDNNHLVTLLQFVECCYVLDRYDDLVRLLDDILEKDPNDYEVRYCLAGACYKQGNLRRATRLINEILSALPGHLGAQQLRSMIAETEGDAPSLGESKRQCTTSLNDSVEVSAVSSSGPEVFDQVDSDLAILEDQKRLKDYVEARQGCEELLSRGNIRAEQRDRAQLLLAEISVLQGDTVPAAITFDEILQRNPDSPRALCGKGAIAAHQSEWRQAQDLFQRAHELKPQYDVPLAGLGLCASVSKDYQLAWDYYQEALSCNPENVRALLGILELGYRLQRLQEVEKVLQGYLEMHPGDLDFLYSLAGCYFAQKRYGEALLGVDRILLLNPEHEQALELKRLLCSQANEAQVHL